MTDPLPPAEVAQAATPAADIALPWYKSKSTVGIIVGILLTVAQKYGLLGEVSSDQLVQLVMVVVPLLVALYGRLTTTRPVVTLTKAGAARANNQST